MNKVLTMHPKRIITKAFSMAVFDGRMGVTETKFYVYAGKAHGRDLFRNKLTGLYLD